MKNKFNISIFKDLEEIFDAIFKITQRGNMECFNITKRQETDQVQLNQN